MSMLHRRPALKQWHLVGLVQLTTQQFSTSTAVTTEPICTQATVGYKGHSCTTARSTGEHKQLQAGELKQLQAARQEPALARLDKAHSALWHSQRALRHG